VKTSVNCDDVDVESGVVPIESEHLLCGVQNAVRHLDKFSQLGTSAYVDGGEHKLKKLNQCDEEANEICGKNPKDESDDDQQQQV
jgi:hypothetical protein